jgi:ABC-type transporter MlaC component
MGNFFVSKDLYKARLEVCRGCNKYLKATGSCKVCGCFMRIKASIAVMSCPLEKWTGSETMIQSEVPKHLKKEVKDIWKKIKSGQAKTHEDKKQMIELYNTIYGGNFKVSTNCSSCLNTAFKGIQRIAQELLS